MTTTSTWKGRGPAETYIQVNNRWLAMERSSDLEASLLDENARRQQLDRSRADRALVRAAATRAGLKVKRCGPGEVKVLDRGGREVARLNKEHTGRRWRVAMAPAVVRTLSSSDPTFDSQSGALSWLVDLQFE